MNYNITNRLYNKIAVITGGASGIGAATVRRFVQEGASVVVADIQDEAGEALCAELCEQRDKAAVYIHTDVSQEDDVKAMIDFAVATYGRVDCLFNNAGYLGLYSGCQFLGQQCGAILVALAGTDGKGV